MWPYADRDLNGWPGTILGGHGPPGGVRVSGLMPDHGPRSGIILNCLSKAGMRSGPKRNIIKAVGGRLVLWVYTVLTGKVILQ